MLWHGKQTRPGRETPFVASMCLSANYDGTIQGRPVA